ncbi:DUF2867 domain-containing protein [Nakamurella lactea]|uniref:DUF2867 domain-containing protein n=1 Tax=Nakamurella lactea TaxID=459515 RepID=UPI000418FFD3|nr:DUF2867 domain-containing protein [Nakamurella lactea]
MSLTSDLPAVMRSQAFERCPQPDFADSQIFAIPAGSEPDPAAWVRRIFSPRSTPSPVMALMAARNVLAPLIGAKSGGAGTFQVDSVAGQEALVEVRDRHLDFWAGIAVDPDRNLLQATTVVRFHGWRGRLYFVPVGAVHGPVFRSMIQRAIRRTAAAG